MKNKKGFQVGDILPLAMVIVVAGIGIAFGLNITGDVRSTIGDDDCSGYWNTSSQTCEVSATNSTQLSANTAAYNATTDTITGVGKFSSKLGIIVTVIVAAILIGILTRYLMRV